MFVSAPILAEFQNVLRRDFKAMDEQIGEMTTRILTIAKMASGTAAIRTVKDDPDDDKILECAVNAGATHVLTYDRHLLKIGRYRGIGIIRPEELLI
ncbi:MAG: PIN domain-containing protein, partial [Candidatus Micrarchaeota archaeon]|nr:PIN domain-containing protein [Candidatus Micrarchaeota archaeon]